MWTQRAPSDRSAYHSISAHKHRCHSRARTWGGVCDRDGNSSHFGHEHLHPRLLSPLWLFGCCPIGAGLVANVTFPDVVIEVTNSPGRLLCAESTGVLSIETLTVKLAAFVRTRMRHGRSLLINRKGLSRRKGRWS